MPHGHIGEPRGIGSRRAASSIHRPPEVGDRHAGSGFPSQQGGKGSFVKSKFTGSTTAASSRTMRFIRGRGIVV
jgi:hypothetical protein